MTVRVYLAAAQVSADAPVAGDLPAERLFVHASDFPEMWVETESLAVPAPGKRVGFFLTGETRFGVGRVTGTIERVVSKETRERIRTATSSAGDTGTK